MAKGSSTVTTAATSASTAGPASGAAATGRSDSNKNATTTKPERALTPEERAYRERVIPALLVRAYHLPGNTSWFQDWYQYMTNNHPVIGIWLHHRYHPVQRNMRIFFLLGSVLFGLALTNIIYLAFVFSDTDYDKGYVEIRVTNATATGTPAIDNNVSALSVTNGNIALWTIGSALHALFDNVIWAFAACTCCMEGRGLTEQKLARYRSTGVFFVVLTVVVVTALATLAVALRAALTSGDTDGAATKVETGTKTSYGMNDDQVQLFQVDGANDFEFVIAYLIELVLNYFFYYFLIGTLLFSGILTCGRFPVVGGRPYELKEEAELASSMEEGQEVVFGAGVVPRPPAAAPLKGKAQSAGIGDKQQLPSKSTSTHSAVSKSSGRKK